MQKVLLRFLGYALAAGLAMAFMNGMAMYAPNGLGMSRTIEGIDVVTSELSPVELLQNILLLFCAGAFTWVANRDRLRRPMALALATLFLAFLIRELDFFLDFYIVDNLWQVLCALLISVALVYGVRNRDRFVQGWKRSWPSAGLAMMLGGVILLIPFAQLVGHEALWMGVMGDSYVRVVKVASEEFIELGAYFLMTAGTVEFLYAWSRLPRSRKHH
jgi:hypothetical protein